MKHTKCTSAIHPHSNRVDPELILGATYQVVCEVPTIADETPFLRVISPQGEQFDRPRCMFGEIVIEKPDRITAILSPAHNKIYKNAMEVIDDFLTYSDFQYFGYVKVYPSKLTSATNKKGTIDKLELERLGFTHALIHYNDGGSNLRIDLTRKHRITRIKKKIIDLQIA